MREKVKRRETGKRVKEVGNGAGNWEREASDSGEGWMGASQLIIFPSLLPKVSISIGKDRLAGRAEQSSLPPINHANDQSKSAIEDTGGLALALNNVTLGVGFHSVNGMNRE